MKRKTSYIAAGVMMFASHIASAAVMLSDGLLGRYQFENNTLDSSANANHGTAYGGLSYIDGVYGKAAHFDESLSTYVLTQYDVPLNSPSYAISTWFRISSYSGVWEILVSRMKDPNASFEDAWDLALLSGNGHANYWYFTEAQGQANANGGPGIPINEWHSLTVNVDNGVGAIYLDGVSIASFLQIGVLDSDGNVPLCIGCNDYNPGYSKHYLNGDLDDLRLYGRSLNEEEIAALADSSYSVPEPSTYTMMLAGLGLLALASRRRKLRASI